MQDTKQDSRPGLLILPHSVTSLFVDRLVTIANQWPNSHSENRPILGKKTVRVRNDRSRVTRVPFSSAGRSRITTCAFNSGVILWRGSSSSCVIACPRNGDRHHTHPRNATVLMIRERVTSTRRACAAARECRAVVEPGSDRTNKSKGERGAASSALKGGVELEEIRKDAACR